MHGVKSPSPKFMRCVLTNFLMGIPRQQIVKTRDTEYAMPTTNSVEVQMMYPNIGSMSEMVPRALASGDVSLVTIKLEIKNVKFKMRGVVMRMNEGNTQK